MSARLASDDSQADNPAPRFAIGELVMVRSSIDPSRNTDCTQVIERHWYEGHADWGWYVGWQYIVAKHFDAWAVEPSLRPRPEGTGLEWETLRDSLAIGRDRVLSRARRARDEVAARTD